MPKSQRRPGKQQASFFCAKAKGLGDQVEGPGTGGVVSGVVVDMSPSKWMVLRTQGAGGSLSPP